MTGEAWQWRGWQAASAVTGAALAGEDELVTAREGAEARPATQRARRPRLPGRRADLTLDQLAALTGAELGAEWARCYGAAAPNLPLELLRLGIAYKLQEAKLGGISRQARSLLRQVTARAGAGPDKKPMPRKLTPGTRLVRDWRGVSHTVTVLDEGFAYDGRHWQSLSAIARAITGSQWNGPLFFGLAERKQQP